ncbi:MAG: glycogen synthase, partial [Planctomycetaceae bacterium]
MDIVFLSTEAVPFAKTGGLGDVCGSLPAMLADAGHRVALIMPAFRCIRQAGLAIEVTDISFAIAIGDRIVGARVLKSKLPGSSVDVYFVDQPQYYDREGLYGDAAGDHPDNCERFAFFCRAALQVIGRVSPQVDIVHCNDWQTGLVPAYMQYHFESHAWMKHARSVMTVHNLAYQGRFWHYDMPLTGLGWDRFTSAGVEFYGSLNFLKAGILLADTITTVSPTYA